MNNSPRKKANLTFIPAVFDFLSASKFSNVKSDAHSVVNILCRWSGMEIYVKTLPRCNPQSLDNERCSGFNNKQINMFRLQLTSGDFFFSSLALSRFIVEALPSMNPHQMPLRWKFITQWLSQHEAQEEIKISDKLLTPRIIVNIFDLSTSVNHSYDSSLKGKSQW